MGSEPEVLDLSEDFQRLSITRERFANNDVQDAYNPNSKSKSRRKGQGQSRTETKAEVIKRIARCLGRRDKTTAVCVISKLSSYMANLECAHLLDASTKWSEVCLHIIKLIDFINQHVSVPNLSMHSRKNMKV